MNLTRKQVRLLLTSAGDHERMPKDKDKKQDLGDVIDLTKKASGFKKLKVPDKYMKKLRKGIKRVGKFNMLNERDDKNLKVIQTGKVIKSDGTPNITSAKDLLAAARNIKGMKFANRGPKRHRNK